MEALTAEALVTGLEKAVAKQGEDFRFPEEWKDSNSCVYFKKDGTPACIIGEVFADNGLTLEELNLEHETNYNSPNTRGVYTGLFSKYFADDIVQGAAAAAQDHQDNKGTWGGSLEAAKHFLRTRVNNV